VNNIQEAANPEQHSMTNGGAKIVFFGTSEFAVPTLERLAAGPWRPAFVVSTPDAPAGRGQEVHVPPVKRAAVELELPLIQPEGLAEGAERLFPPGVDLFVVASYGKILPPELLKIPRHGSLGVHPSLLPRWRGASPIQHAILAGDEETGVSLILMDEAVDHGPVLKVAKFKNAGLTAPELTTRLAELGAELLVKAIPEWLAGKIAPQPQDESKVTWTKLLKREEGRIDWSEPAAIIERKTRAFAPWPGTYAFWQRPGGELRLMIEKAAVAADGGPAPGRAVGTVFVKDGRVRVETGNGVLEIERLKPEGKTSMAASEFLRGHPDFSGAVLR